MALKLINNSEFLHLPKTGGSWVSKVLNVNNLVDSQAGGHKHADYDRLMNWRLCGNSKFILNAKINRAIEKAQRKFPSLDNLNKKSSAPYRFCFVRHPLSWYESWWKYMSGLGWNDWGEENDPVNWHPNSILNGLGSDDFNQFVSNVINKRPGYVSELYFAFTKPGINFIGKTENLSEDLMKVLDIQNLGYDKQAILDMNRVNVSKAKVKQPEWDPEIRSITMKLELPSLIHFDYLSDQEYLEMGITKRIPPHKSLYTRGD